MLRGGGFFQRSFLVEPAVFRFCRPRRHSAFIHVNCKSQSFGLALKSHMTKKNDAKCGKISACVFPSIFTLADALINISWKSCDLP